MPRSPKLDDVFEVDAEGLCVLEMLRPDVWWRDADGAMLCRLCRMNLRDLAQYTLHLGTKRHRQWNYRYVNFGELFPWDGPEPYQ